MKLFGTEHARTGDQADLNALPQSGRDGGSESSLALPRADTRATRDSEGTAVDNAAHSPTRDDALVDFLRDIRHHLDELIFADDEVKDKHVDRVSRRVMDRENFSRDNRERVETSQAFKEFLCENRLSLTGPCMPCAYVIDGVGEQICATCATSLPDSKQ